MAFSLRLQEQCARKSRMVDLAKETFLSLLEPFRLDKCYPPTPVQLPDGRWIEKHEIQPHQKKLHDRKSLSGKTPKFLCFSGGVGCQSGKEIVSGVPMGDLAHTGTVSTMFGVAQSSPVYRKGQADLWRVRLRSGRECVVTEHHRFLTLSGWRPLKDLGVGDLIASDGSENGTSCLGRSTGYQRRYSTYSHPCDELPSPEEVACRLEIGKFYGPDTFHPCTSGLYPSTGDFFCREATILRADGVEYRDGSGDGGSLRRLPQTFWQSEVWTLLPHTGRLFQSLATFEEGYSLCLSLCRFLSVEKERILDSRPVLSPPQQHFPVGQTLPLLLEALQKDFVGLTCSQGSVALESLLCLAQQCEDSWRPTSGSRVLSWRQEQLQWLDRLSSCVTSDYNSTIFWDAIESVQYEEFGDFFDLTVPDGRHYSSAGIIHSNSGKTYAMCVEILKLLRTVPGIAIVCVVPYDYYMDEFLLPTWYRVLPEDSVHIKSSNKKSRSIILTNGSTIRFKAYDDPDKVRGWEAHVIWVEEAAELGDGNNDKAFAIWQNLLMRLRASRPVFPPRVYVTQNPKGHNWVWKVFLKPEPDAPQPLGDVGVKTVFGHTEDGKERTFYEWEKINSNGDVFYTIAMGSTANSYIPPGYVATMLGQMADTPGMRERMVEGMWNPINSMVYDFPIYSERTHVVEYNRFLEYWEYDEVPSWLRVVVGIDCGGQRSPWAVEYYAQTEDGHWVCFDEIYQVGVTWGEIADMIIKKSERFTNIEYWIDPISSNQKSGPTSLTIEEEFRARGIPTRMPRGYNKQGGIGRIQDMLCRDRNIPCPYLDDLEEIDEEGTMRYTVGMSNLYYLTNVPGKHSQKNPKGHACPGNIAEKSVYRYDSTKVREAKSAEEGLSPVQSEKIMDRDDHAQTAEMFFGIGIKPFVKKTVTDRSHRQPVGEEVPKVMYGRGGKHRRVY